MILTGKALEDFNKWNYDNDFGYIDHEPTSLVVHFENLDENLRNTIITDWFDSVGIYINTINNVDGSIYCRILLLDQAFYGSDRQDATKKAIEKANEIYNTNTNSYDYN